MEHPPHVLYSSRTPSSESKMASAAQYHRYKVFGCFCVTAHLHDLNVLFVVSGIVVAAWLCREYHMTHLTTGTGMQTSRFSPGNDITADW